MDGNISINRDRTSGIKYKMAFFYLVIATFSMNFLGLGDFIPLVVVPYTLYLIMTLRFTKHFMFSFSLLFLFNIVYAILLFLYDFGSPLGIIGKTVYPVIFLVLGYKLMGEKLQYKRFVTMMFLFILSMASYGFLSVLKTGMTYGGMDSALTALGGRLTIDLWSDTLLSATILNSYLSFGLAILPLLFLSVKRKEVTLKYKLLSLTGFAISLYASTQVGSRTGILIVILSVLMVIFFAERSGIKKVKRVGGMIAVAITLWAAYNMNLFNIKMKILTSDIYNRMSGTDLSEESRFGAWKDAFTGIFKHPSGGRETVMDLSYAHNLWLDVGYDAGIIPFSLLVVFTLSAVGTIIIFISNNHPPLVKVLSISMSTAFLTIFMLEPVMQGFGVYFTIFCFYIGALLKLNYLHKTNKVFH